MTLRKKRKKKKNNHDQDSWTGLHDTKGTSDNLFRKILPCQNPKREGGSNSPTDPPQKHLSQTRPGACTLLCGSCLEGGASGRHWSRDWPSHLLDLKLGKGEEKGWGERGRGKGKKTEGRGREREIMRHPCILSCYSGCQPLSQAWGPALKGFTNTSGKREVQDRHSITQGVAAFGGEAGGPNTADYR